jgi:alpha-mannosidase
VVATEERGPLRAALKLEHRMMVPVSASKDEKSRSPERKELVIKTVLSLTKHSRRLDIKTWVFNTVKDHRLRVVFKTGIDTKESHAETPFAVVKREHREYDVTKFLYEHPARVAPMQRFVTIHDETKGFTLISKGLPEYELKLEERGVLALTLLRCVGKLSGRDLVTRPGGAAGWWSETPDAQCLGEHAFEYSIVPHGVGGREMWSSVLGDVECFTVPPLTVRRKNEQHILTSSFVAVEPPSLMLSALKTAGREAGIVLRLCNPVGVAIDGLVHFKQKVSELFRVKMNEEVIERLAVGNGRDISLTVKPFEVVTLLVKEQVSSES